MGEDYIPLSVKIIYALTILFSLTFINLSALSGGRLGNIKYFHLFELTLHGLEVIKIQIMSPNLKY